MTIWIDRVAFVMFGFYSLGLVIMLIWTVVQVARGKVELSATLQGVHSGDAISLSKLQMFIWTLVMVFAWLFRMVRDPATFPVLPNQALLLMGISGATYLAAKQMGSRSGPTTSLTPPTEPAPTEPEPPPAPGDGA